ncbi:MAG: DNA polymerase III subunit delta' [Alphaproteobacteria bacterium]|nr:DNA polymerase III subunit delta' [Alphaproteobacteria bacterium]
MEIAAEELGPVAGHEVAKNEFLSVLAADKLHHGWLLRGPRGVGKARLALQFAARLLGGASLAGLSVDADDAVGRLIVAGSHPDFRIIRRPLDDKGKMKTEIPVDSVRELSAFFSLRPAMGGWRVAIIDAVDELNRFGANALLKTLEEPPGKSVLLLVSHGEQALLPTVRSRCRVLSCRPLSEVETIEALKLGQMPQARAEEVAKLAPGRPGRALAVQGPESDSAVGAVRNALRTIDRVDAGTLHAALTLAAKSDVALGAAIDTLRSSLQKRAARELDPVVAGEWATVVLDVIRLEAEARELNMDKAQTISAALSRVARLARG